MEHVAKIVALVTAIVALTTAIFTYRAVRLKEISPSSTSRIKLVKIAAEPIDKRYWRLAQLVFFCVGFLAVAALVMSVQLVRETGLQAFWLLLLGLIAVTVNVWVFWKLLRLRPWEVPSLIRRKTSIELDADSETVFSQSEIALRKIGAQITSLDKPSGVIEGRKGLSWRSFGTKMTISVANTKGKFCIVSIESSSILPFELFDIGENRRNVGRFIQYLVS